MAALTSPLKLLLGCAIAAVGCSGAAAAPELFADLRSDAEPIAQPRVAALRAGASYRDPVFGTRVTRITASKPTEGIVPEYSKAQAFNSDATRLLLRGTDASWHLFNARTFARVTSKLPVGDIEPRWSPTNPDQLVYLDGDSVYRYSVRRRSATRIARFAGLGPLSSGAEQELSVDGRYLAVHGPIREAAGGAFRSTDAFVVDLERGTRGPIKRLTRPKNPNDFLDYVAITPDGRQVMVMWAYRGAELYTRTFRFVRRLTTWDEHGDFCRDRAGRWSFVQARYRAQTNDEVIESSPLDGGTRRTLWKSPRFNLALHVSCRNTKRWGWAYISTYWDGLGQRPRSITAFENEIFALGLASTVARPLVRRIAHTRMVERADYFDEPHATVRQDGRLVLFGSNFGAHVRSEAHADTYAVDVRTG